MDPGVKGAHFLLAVGANALPRADGPDCRCPPSHSILDLVRSL